MPFKNKKRALEYGRKWRRAHPQYMSVYGRKYYALGKKPAAPLTKTAVLPTLEIA